MRVRDPSRMAAVRAACGDVPCGDAAWRMACPDGGGPPRNEPSSRQRLSWRRRGCMGLGRIRRAEETAAEPVPVRSQATYGFYRLAGKAVRWFDYLAASTSAPDQFLSSPSLSYLARMASTASTSRRGCLSGGRHLVEHAHVAREREFYPSRHQAGPQQVACSQMYPKTGLPRPRFGAVHLGRDCLSGHVQSPAGAVIVVGLRVLFDVKVGGPPGGFGTLFAQHAPLDGPVDVCRPGDGVRGVRDDGGPGDAAGGFGYGVTDGVNGRCLRCPGNMQHVQVAIRPPVPFTCEPNIENGSRSSGISNGSALMRSFTDAVPHWFRGTAATCILIQSWPFRPALTPANTYGAFCRRHGSPERGKQLHHLLSRFVGVSTTTTHQAPAYVPSSVLKTRLK